MSTALWAAFLAACSAVSVPEIALDLSNPKQPSVVVNGLSRRDLAALERARLSPDAWTAAFRVSVIPGKGIPASLPIAGRYAIADRVVRFTPMYPLDAGHGYEVVFNPPAVPGAGLDRVAGGSTIVWTPPPAATVHTTVEAIYPTGPEVPANLLRMYVAFSGPMGTRTGQDYIKILDASGAEMPGALLPLDTDLWNGDHTRFTILFDPGRVKRGILPNRTAGRPLRPGNTFTIVVQRDWPDAQAMPLVSEFRKDYRVGPPVEAPLSTSAWRVDTPAAGSRDPLRVSFPSPLDHAIVRRALSVVRNGSVLAGSIGVSGGETEWRFVPRDPWTAGGHELWVLRVLEDPSGNRIGHAFETVSPDDDTAAAPSRLPFVIR